MKDIDKNIKNNLFLVIFADLLLISLFVWLLYFTGRQESLKMKESVSELLQLENMQSNFSTYNRAIKDTTEERNRLDKFVVNKASAAIFIEDLEDLAAKAGVVLTKTVSVEKQTPQVRENMLRFNMRARGSLSDIFYFMTLIEELPYKTRFKSISMGMSDESIQSDLIPASSNLKSAKREVVWAGDVTFELLSYINE